MREELVLKPWRSEKKKSK